MCIYIPALHAYKNASMMQCCNANQCSATEHNASRKSRMKYNTSQPYLDRYSSMQHFRFVHTMKYLLLVV